MKFWFNIKSKELKTFDDSYSHAFALGIEAFCKGYRGDALEYEECTDSRMRELQNLGWVRGYFSQRRELNLSISKNYENDIAGILSQLPYEYMLVKRMLIDIDSVYDLKNASHTDYDIEVDMDNGEDALTAWKRKDSFKKQYAKISYRDNIIKLSRRDIKKY